MPPRKGEQTPLDIQKWSYEKRAYEPYTPDPAWFIVLYSPFMDLPVNCASCGKDMLYGEGYSSREIQNSIGLSYPVCYDCYLKELDTESEHG